MVLFFLSVFALFDVKNNHRMRFRLKLEVENERQLLICEFFFYDISLILCDNEFLFFEKMHQM